MPRIRPTTQWAMAWQQKYRKTHPTNMETRAPVVECADRAAARARQAATTPEICIAFPTVIERRPKILRLEDNADPFMFALTCRSRQGCCVTSISPGLIDVGLHFRADVLGVGQIKFSGFQALVAKPSLDVHQVHTVPQPAGRAGLSQAVEMVFLADRACGTGNLRGLPQMIFPLLDRRFAVSAVQPGTLGDGLELAEEVALRVSILIHKNPAAMGRILFPLLEQFNQFGGQRNPAFLVMLRDKVDIFFAVTCHMVFAMFPVNVVPRGVLHFLFAAGGVQKE